MRKWINAALAVLACAALLIAQTVSQPGSGGGGGGTSPGGSTTQLQYNNSGAFGGITGATSNGTSLLVTTQAVNDNSTKAASTAYVDRVAIPFTPLTGVQIYDEFASGDPANAKYIGTLGWSNSAGTASQVIGDAGTFSSEEVLTGASSTNAANLFLTNVGGAVFNYSTVTFNTLIRAAISATTSVSVFMGMSGVTGIGEAQADFVGIAYDATVPDATWECVARFNNGGATRTAITGSVVDANYHNFRIRSTSAGTALCSVDGGAEVGVSVPATKIDPELDIETRTGSTRNLKIDYFYQNIDVVR